MTWSCPECGRAFTRANQRHACGTGGSDVVRGRPAHVVEVYRALEKFVRALGDVELVTRERYVLMRTERIFTDVVIMSDAVRIAIHLQRKVEHPLFFKVAIDKKKVTHVAKMKTGEDLEAMKPFVREAYETS